MTSLADVRVGESAVLVAVAEPALDIGRARRLVEFGLRPGATVRVMMRTAGGGRVLGVDNLRIVVDRHLLGQIPVTVARPAAPPGPTTLTAAPSTGRAAALLAGRVAHRTAAPAPCPVLRPPFGPHLAQDDGGENVRGENVERADDRVTQRRRSRFPLDSAGRRLRLLGRPPGLTVLQGEPLGDGTD